MAAASRPLDRLTSLGSARGSEDFNATADVAPRMSTGNPFQDPPQVGVSQRAHGTAAEKTTEDMLRDIWARPLAGSQNPAPFAAGGQSSVPPDGPRTSIASDFRAAMGVDRRLSGPFDAPFDAGEVMTDFSGCSHPAFKRYLMPSRSPALLKLAFNLQPVGLLMIRQSHRNQAFQLDAQGATSLYTVVVCLHAADSLLNLIALAAAC